MIQCQSSLLAIARPAPPTSKISVKVSHDHFGLWWQCFKLCLDSVHDRSCEYVRLRVVNASCFPIHDGNYDLLLASYVDPAYHCSPRAVGLFHSLCVRLNTHNSFGLSGSGSHSRTRGCGARLKWSHFHVPLIFLASRDNSVLVFLLHLVFCEGHYVGLSSKNLVQVRRQAGNIDYLQECAAFIVF